MNIVSQEMKMMMKLHWLSHPENKVKEWIAAGGKDSVGSVKKC